MTNEYDFLKKQRYEYYKGTTEIMDNEVNELVEDVIDVLNQKAYNINELLKIKQFQAQRITELEEQLRNAIVPKFKIGQEVWWIDTRVIESYLIDSIVITEEQFRYYGYDGLWLGDNELFATKEEAQAKLEELKGE